MNVNYFFIIGIGSIAISVLFLNVYLLLLNPHKSIKRVCSICFVASIFKYLTLMVYGAKPTLLQVQALRPFYFITVIGLFIPLASALWYITPFCKTSISYIKYLLLLLPWHVFHFYILIAPIEKIEKITYGYDFHLSPTVEKYFIFSQGSFFLLMTTLCIIGWLRYKNEALRSQYVTLILAQILLLIDLYVARYTTLITVFPLFTMTEIGGFLAIAYSFSKIPIEKKYKK
jgi:hypothetical protein